MRYLSTAVGLAAVAGLALSLTACQDEPPPAAASEEFQVAAQDAAGWGDVKGQVVWGGNGPPEVKKLDVNKDQDHCLAKGPILSEEWVINEKNKGVRWAVVWLLPDPPPDPEKNPDAKLAVHPSLKEVPKDKVEMDQPACKFEPHVVAFRQGQVLVAKNSAPVAHNFNYAGIRNISDNKLMPPKTSLEITGFKASPFPVIVSCTIHPWMKGYARVFDHPYFAVTDADGKFEIKQAPAGKCRVVVWQEAMGYKTDKDGEPIEVKAGSATDLGPLPLKPR